MYVKMQPNIPNTMGLGQMADEPMMDQFPSPSGPWQPEIVQLGDYVVTRPMTPIYSPGPASFYVVTPRGRGRMVRGRRRSY